jgi:hypothetical protein
MGSLVTTNGGGNALAAYGGANPWAEAARGVADGAYLKFNGNKGDITFGSDDDDLPEKSLIIVDMQSMALGWICWDDSQVVEEVLVNVVDGKPPLEHELTDHGPFNDDDDGWREAASVSAVLYSYGEDTKDEAVGTKLLFKTSTGGQVRSLKKLAGQYGRLFMQHPDELPIVELTVESYMPKVKKHGRKYSLVMKIVGWVSAAEAEAMMAGDHGDDESDYEPEEKPKAASRRDRDEDEAPAPRRSRREEPAEEDEAPAPRRGRREEPAEEDEAPAPRRSRREEPADEDEAPAPRRGTRREEPDEDEDAAPAPRGRSEARRARDAAPADEDAQDEDVAPAPRRSRREEPAEEDEAPAPRRGRREEPAEEDEAPAPRSGRGAPSNARLRRFD